MINTFISVDIKQNPEHHNSLKRMNMLGLRFDIQSVAMLLIIPHISSMIFSIFPTTETNFIFSGLIFILSLLFSGLIIGNYFYYKTYNTYYDIFIFGLVEDDTKAVLKSIYDDYPIFKILLSLILISLIATIITYKMNELILKYSLDVHWSINIVILVMFILAIRGTIKSKPLSKIHAQVSSLPTINYMVPNGLSALKWAIKDHKQKIDFKPVDKLHGEKLISDLFECQSLLCKTDENTYLEKNKPHVVFTLMESFGCNMLQFDNEVNNDLLGNLRPHFSEDILFKNFLSACNGTAASLFSIYCYSTNENISQSSAQKTKLPHSPFLTYRQQGYRTIFITSGNAMWRSLATYLPQLGVDEIYDQNNIMDIFPEAKSSLSYWGIADEYSFKLAEKLLKESEHPLFINILTITNHPPYLAPKGYQAKAINCDSIKGKIGDTENERKNILSAYQYACSAFGDFISNIKSSSIKEKTIIAASGDHHVRGMKLNYPDSAFISFAVPFYLYIPNSIRKNMAINVDQNAISSHKDIMPTLYSLSLSNTEYWNIGGRNLCGTQPKEYKFAYNDAGIWADESGVILLNSNMPIKYSWNNDYSIGKQIDINKNEIEKIYKYQQLLDWQMNFLVKGYK